MRTISCFFTRHIGKDIRSIIMTEEVECCIVFQVSDFGSMDYVGSREVSAIAKKATTKQVLRDAKEKTLQSHFVHLGSRDAVFVNTSSVVVARVYSGFNCLTPIGASEKHCRKISYVIVCPVGRRCVL